jgi:hypothetical protein
MGSPPHNQPGAGQHQNANAASAAQPERKPRSPGSIYALAARQRRLQQQYANLHHPPSLDEIWICEFCEYESIFGHPPEALIRQYEIKDRKERRRLAEKRRLLEKAKMKGRKGKKATKNAAKNAAAAAVQQQPPHQHAYDRQPSHLNQTGGHHDNMGDEYLGDEYDDELPHLQPVHPTSVKQPAPIHNHTKQPVGEPGGGGTVRPS